MQSSLLIDLEGTLLHFGDGSLPVQTDSAATLSLLNLTAIKQPLPWNAKTVQIVGIFNESQEVPVSEHIPFCLGPLRDTHHFLLSSFNLIHSLGQDFSENYHARISFSQSGEIILEIENR